jgi:uncharacterized circularly permuted ATP-grasp superfamily protein
MKSWWPRYQPQKGYIGQHETQVSNYLFKSPQSIQPFPSPSIQERGQQITPLKARISAPVANIQSYSHTQSYVEHLIQKSPDELFKQSRHLTQFLKRRDLTFQKMTSQGTYKIFPVPCTTSVVSLPKSVFNQIEKAAQVLIVALRAVIQDIYGSESVEKSAFVKHLPPDAKKIFIHAVKSSPHYFPQLHHPSMKSYPFFDNVGLDLVLVEDFLDYPQKIKKHFQQQTSTTLPNLPFRILELNAGSPSGAANNMNILEGLYAQDPEHLEKLGKILPNDHFSVLAETYKSLGENWTDIQDAIQVVLPPGGLNGAAPEIHNLAAYSGLVYADPVQLFCDEKGYIRLRTINGSNPIVNAIYSRINADSALFNPEKGLFLRDAETGEPIYLRDNLKIDEKGEASLILDAHKNPIPLQSDYAVPGLIDAIIQKKIYMGGLNRILDNKIILPILTAYAPAYFEKKLEKLGLTKKDECLQSPETLPSSKESVEILKKNPLEWVVKSPNLSGGSGVYILQTLSAKKRQEILSMVESDPENYAYQKLVKIGRVPVMTKKQGKTQIVNLAADIRLWSFYGAEKNALPKLTHNALVRLAPQEKGPLSSIVNTSKGGGYAPFVVVDDCQSPNAVSVAEFTKPHPLVPFQSHLPMFVAAQLIQISRLINALENELYQDQPSLCALKNLMASLKLQAREVMTFIDPRSMESIYSLQESFQHQAFESENARFYSSLQKLKIELTQQMKQHEKDASFLAQFYSLAGQLKIMTDDCQIWGYRNADQKQDKLNWKIFIRNLSQKEKIKHSQALKIIKAILALKPASYKLSSHATAKSLAKIKELKEQIRKRLHNSEKTVEFAKIFLDVHKHVPLAFESLGLGHDSSKKDLAPKIATLFESSEGVSLTETNFISEDLRFARLEWLEKSQDLKDPEKINRLREAHFKKFPRIAHFQKIINQGIDQNNSTHFLELLPALPYAHYNLKKLAEHFNISLEELFQEKLTPNRICVLSSEQIYQNHLSALNHAGECFAKKRKSHGLFSDSDITIWVRKELDPFTLLYTAGHEAIHYHQTEALTKMEARALSDGAIAQAYFLNYYGNFLGISNVSLENLSYDIASERQPFYGLTDVITTHFYHPFVTKVRSTLQKSNSSYESLLKRYGSLLGLMTPNSLQVKVKALQEVIPALENAKNIRFAKELGLDIPWDEFQSVLPTANSAQKKAFKKDLDDLLSGGELNHSKLLCIANHQYYGVYFRNYDLDHSPMRLQPLLGVISLGNSYNQTQQ